MRATHPAQQLALTAAMLVVFAGTVAAMLWLGRRHNWMSALDKPMRMTLRAASRLPGLRSLARGGAR